MEDQSSRDRADADGQYDRFVRQALSEVYALMEFLSDHANPAISKDAAPSKEDLLERERSEPDLAQPTTLIQRAMLIGIKLRYETVVGENDAAFLVMARDLLNERAAPATGSSIVFTRLVMESKTAANTTSNYTRDQLSAASVLTKYVRSMTWGAVFLLFSVLVLSIGDILGQLSLSQHGVVTYVLPILCGLLGAILSMLRQFGKRSTARLLTPRDHQAFPSQAIVGVLTGALIGWFINSLARSAAETVVVPAATVVFASALSFLAANGVATAFASIDFSIGETARRLADVKSRAIGALQSATGFLEVFSALGAASEEAYGSLKFSDRVRMLSVELAVAAIYASGLGWFVASHIGELIPNLRRFGAMLIPSAFAQTATAAALSPGVIKLAILTSYSIAVIIILLASAYSALLRKPPLQSAKDILRLTLGFATGQITAAGFLS
jgi:hypothetical protein